MFLAAAQRHQSGHLADAESLYRQVLELDPGHVEGLHNLGVLAQQTGRHGMAEDLIGKAIALNDRIAHFHQSLANTLRIQGKLDECASSCQRAIALKPDFGYAHYTLARALSGLGRLDEAAACFRRAIALEPTFADAHCHLGAILMGQSELDQAARCFRRAIELKPDLADAHMNLGIMSRELGELDEAASSIRRAIALQPAFAQAHCELGAVLNLQGQPEDGRASVNRALELGPDRADSWVQLGKVRQTLGEMDLARAAFLRALELDPRSGVAVHLLSGLLSLNEEAAGNHAAREHISRLAADVDQMRPAVRDLAMFAMSKLLEDQGDYDGAFALMAQANALVRARLSFDIAEAERRLEAVARVFDRPWLERLENSGCDSNRPIFIVGMPRSGTTLVEQIISAHPQVFGAGELPNLPRAIEASHGRSTYPGWARTMRIDDGLALAQAYLASLPPSPSGEVRVTDKMLRNFEHLGLIHLFLPNARIIHCRRDPRDVCLSCFAAGFHQGPRFTFDLVELGRFWRAYDRLMAHWRAVLPPGRMLEVPYEDVVEDVEAWARRLIAHCELGWDDACLRFYESGRPVHTASLVQVRQPIYASSVGRWRRFARHLGPLLGALGEPWTNGA
jgi:tetratricopeptide (TPR) repeat protein